VLQVCVMSVFTIVARCQVGAQTGHRYIQCKRWDHIHSCRQFGKDKGGQGCQHVWAELYYLVKDSGYASEQARGGAFDSGYLVYQIRVAQAAY
jgi:hypothetical protein